MNYREKGRVGNERPVLSRVSRGQILMADLEFETPNFGHVLIVLDLSTPLVFACQSPVLSVSDVLLALILAIQKSSCSDPWPCSDFGSEQEDLNLLTCNYSRYLKLLYLSVSQISHL